MEREKVKEIRKQISFIDMVLFAIQNVEVPMLIYDEEKEVVKRALQDYRSKLDDSLWDK